MQGSSILICLPHRAAAAAFYIIHATFAQCFLSPGASCWEASSNSRGRKFTIFSRVFIGWWFLFSSSGRRCFPRLKFCQKKKNWPPNLYRWCVPRYFRTGVEITNFDRSTTAIKRLAKKSLPFMEVVYSTILQSNDICNDIWGSFTDCFSTILYM